jgi:hypothetical protein
VATGPKEEIDHDRGVRRDSGEAAVLTVTMTTTTTTTTKVGPIP